MKCLYVFLFLFAISFSAYAVESPKPNPSPSSNVSYSKMSERQNLDDLTYAKKMQYRKEREEYNQIVKDYNAMILKRAENGGVAASPAPTPAPGQNTKLFNEKRAAEKKQAKMKKKVLVS